MKTKLLAALLFLPLLFTTSCEKEDVTQYQTGQVTMRMKNDTTTCVYEEVNIDVRSVEVRIGGSTGGDWYKLQTQAGIYNVLTLRNGIDALIANEKVPTGEIMAVRLNLGTNNSIRKNGTLYPIAIPAGEETGLQYEIYEMIGPTDLNLHLVFNAGQSVVQDGQESFHLKPVIWVYEDSLR